LMNLIHGSKAQPAMNDPEDHFDMFHILFVFIVMYLLFKFCQDVGRFLNYMCIKYTREELPEPAPEPVSNDTSTSTSTAQQAETSSGLTAREANITYLLGVRAGMNSTSISSSGNARPSQRHNASRRLVKLPNRDTVHFITCHCVRNRTSGTVHVGYMCGTCG
jgi:hypothetical protein